MAKARKTPAERPELRAAVPHQGGPLGSSGATPATPATPAVPATPAAATGAAAPAATTAPVVPAAPGSDKSTDPVTASSDKAPESGPAADPESSKTPDASNKTPEPVDKTTAPSEKTTAPSEKTTAPSEKTAAPSEETAAPSDKSAAPTERSGKTAETSKDPAPGDKSDKSAETGTKSDKDPELDTASDKAVAPRKRGLVRRSLGLVGRGGRGVAAWARRPSGRVIVPSVIVLLLIGLAGTAGAYLVPRALEAAPTPSTTPTFGDAGAAPAPSASDPFGLPGGLPSDPAGGVFPAYTLPPTTAAGVPALPTTAAGTTGTGTIARPADALAAWAQTTGTKAGIPVIAVQAYGYAELVTTQTTPTCHLTWTTLAAIGKVASGHGSSNGAVLGVDGVAQPTIYGLQLDGQGGRLLVKDTDQGVLDQDITYDREVGPMKLTPGAWQTYSVDADRNGTADINDVDDAALAAATQLCKDAKGSVRDLSRADSWWDAVLNYNGGTLRATAQKVFEAANEYGQRSRT